MSLYIFHSLSLSLDRKVWTDLEKTHNQRFKITERTTTDCDALYIQNDEALKCPN